jgi:ribosome maturation factor RimP
LTFEVGRSLLYLLLGGIMQSKLDSIKSYITDPLKEKDIIVSSVEWITEGKNNNTLKVVLDKVNGIDLDAIVEATNIINPILDEHDLIAEQYTLEVSSKERGE